MVQISNVSKTLGENLVLNRLSLDVGDGSIFGLVGVNGAGKSTLLRLIAGVYEPDAEETEGEKKPAPGGCITLDGHDTFREPEIRKKIAFVSDELQFPFAANIRTMKSFYETFYDFDEKRYQKYARIFQLDERTTINNMSKGMKRRVSLLFALSIRPKLMLLDEAYDGLEPLARYRFKQILVELVEDEGISVIISGHNLKELEDICDSFGILDDGHIIRHGDLEDKKAEIHKYQMAFTQEKMREKLLEMGLTILRFEQEGQVIRAVIKGDQQEVEDKIRSLDPLLLNVLPINFEEMFIYEVDRDALVPGGNREEKWDE